MIRRLAFLIATFWLLTICNDTVAAPYVVRPVVRVSLGTENVADARFLAEVTITHNHAAGVIMLDTASDLLVIQISELVEFDCTEGGTVVLYGSGIYVYDVSNPTVNKRELLIFITPTIVAGEPDRLIFDIVGDTVFPPIVVEGKLSIPEDFCD